MINIKRLLSSLKGEQAESVDGSTAITDSKVIEAFVKDSNNTFLVSFPRTGSHWLRMIMELYFLKPSLVRAFYYFDATEYLTLHSHDKDLDIERENVIYLYRDPVDTVFSQLNYYNEDVNDRSRITYWADQYGQHLNKWLFQENFTKRKSVLTYEGMKEDLAEEFQKVVAHFGQKLDKDRLRLVAERITKEEVKKKTKHDPQVLQLSSCYNDARVLFKQFHSKLIWDALTADREQLCAVFSRPLAAM